MRFTCADCGKDYDEGHSFEIGFVCPCRGSIIETFDPADYDEEGRELSGSLQQEH